MACALFLVDPTSELGVRWRPSGTPSPGVGFPLRPGKALAVAGEGSIRNSKFATDGIGSARVHVIYFDRVDVVAADFSVDVDGTGTAGLESVRGVLEEILAELRQIRPAATAVLDNS